MKEKLTDEDRSNIIVLYLRGETCDEIARKTGFSADTVSDAEKDFHAQVCALKVRKEEPPEG